MVFTIQTKKEIVMNKIIKTIIWPIILVPAAYLALVWNKLPQKVALHFNLEGTADKFGSKNELLIMIIVLTILVAAVYIFLPLVYKIDPKKTAIANKTRLQRLGFAIALFISFVDCMIINSAEQGGLRFNIRLIFGSIGLLWCIIGNYMHNIKPNYFAGLRLPWTLNNEENWRKTHLLAGKLWFAGGLLIGITCLFISGNLLLILFFCITIIITIIPCIYSYRLYRSQKNLET
jgi:uncharacterized membrane protein